MSNKYEGQHILVYGLGESGNAAAQLLLKQGAHVMIRDAHLNERIQSVSEKLRLKGASIELGSANFSHKRFDFAVVSPGINMRDSHILDLKLSQTEVISEIELAYQFCECPIVAVTGTNGKTTTTELIGQVLLTGGKRTITCGNIGNAFSHAVQSSNNLDVMTVEVSSFQLETIQKFKPKIAVFLNITPDHLDRHVSMEEYLKCKLRIFENQDSSDYAIVNKNIKKGKIQSKVVTISTDEKADYCFENGWLFAHGQPCLELSRTQLTGKHNAENLLAAFAVGDIYHIERKLIIEALCSYRPRPHRCEFVAKVNGITFINDSKATNIDAMLKCIQDKSNIILIAGGKDKGFDFTSVRDIVAQHVKTALLIGESQSKIFKAWHQRVKCERMSDLRDALRFAFENASDGDLVVLSPGCASFDMFENYEDRGNQFIKIVHEMKTTYNKNKE